MTKVQTLWTVEIKPRIIFQKQRRRKPIKAGQLVFHLYVQSPSGETSAITRIVFNNVDGTLSFNKALRGYARHIKDTSLLDIEIKLGEIIGNMRDVKKYGIVEIYRNHVDDSE